jgi:2-iminobutanoate/2-iminopropanoate deaminase
MRRGLEGATMTEQAERTVVATEKAPAAIGPYSQAIVANGLVFTAGQIPIDPETMKLVEGDITAQTERVMQNLAEVLQAAGSGLDRIVKTTCFLADLNDFAAFNAVYGRYLGADAPPRSTVQVAKLPMGALVEVECVALAP